MNNFHFLYPDWFWLLIPLALVLGGFWFYRQQHGQWGQWVDPQLQPYVIIPAGGTQQSWGLSLLALAGIIAIIAMAGPAWEKKNNPVFRLQSSLVVALDLSRSMQSQDVTPNRLTHAQFELSDLLDARQEGQTGLVVYAGDAFVVSPLTDDTETIKAQMKALHPNIMPVAGSRADLALEKAAELLRQSQTQQGDILLITDEILKPERVKTIAQKLYAEGFRVSALGIGTAEGAPIPLENGQFLQDRQGHIVVPKLGMQALQTVTQEGGGLSVLARFDDRDLQQLQTLFSAYSSEQEQQEKTTDKTADSWQNEGVWLVLLLLPLAAFAFRRGWLFVAVILLWQPPEPVLAWEWADLWQRPEQRAEQALENNQPEKAATLFPDPARQGVAHYLAGDYATAAEALSGANDVSGLYNRGNALAKQGHYEEALTVYEQALAQSEHENARYNRDLVAEALKRQQQQDNQQQSSEQNKEDQEQKQDQQSQDQQSSSGDQQQDQQSSSGDQQQDQQSSSSDQQQDQQSSSGDQQQDQQSASGDQQQDQQSASGDQQQDQQSASGDQQQDQQSASGDQQQDQQSASGDQQQNQENAREEHGEDKQNAEQQAAQEKEQNAEDQHAENQTAQNEHGLEEEDTAKHQQGDDKQQDPINQAGQEQQDQQAPSQHTMNEQEQASEQWLRRIPDDPSGLWRRKFQYQYKQQGQTAEEQTW